ncbi:MAG: hypothetical protein LAT76_09255 [Schleiferiaceae bacterium]|nr:hypothetical protein [Schleiferiaceae bacterium]
MMKHFGIAFLLLTVAAGCDGYWGKKTDLEFIDVPEFMQREIAYVPIQPVISDFMKPVDICIGFDELIYVVDGGAEEVVSMDESGKILARFRVPGVRHVVQDRRFNLLAIGTYDTVINGVQYDLSCIYRIDMQRGSLYGLQYAEITNKIIHPYYFKSEFSATDAQVRFNGIGVFGSMNPNDNNRFVVTRSGPSSNNAGRGPDDAVIRFNNKDEYQSPVFVSTSSGLFNNYFRKPYGVTTFTQPPQFSASTRSDFYVTMLGDDAALSVQLIQFNETDFGAEFRPNIFPVGDTSEAEGYLNQPNRFRRPIDVAMTGDITQFVFVVDSEADSVYQFTSNGIEGVPPLPGANTTKYQLASFGGTGSGLTQFRDPRAAAMFRRILYVADAGNGRVLRFRLTSDFD